LDLSGFEEDDKNDFNLQIDDIEELFKDDFLAELQNEEEMVLDSLFDAELEEDLFEENFQESKEKVGSYEPERKNKFWDDFIEGLSTSTGDKIISQILSTSDAYADIDDMSLNGYSRSLYAIMRGREPD
jgi:hypothetical protein